MADETHLANNTQRYFTDFLVRQVGEPVLRTRAEEVTDFSDPALQAFIDELDAARVRNGGIGIAANQVGILKRIAVICIPAGERLGYGEVPETPLTVLVNPTIVHCSEETLRAPEACLSIKGYEGIIERPAQVLVEAQDRYGNQIRLEADRLFGRALQHEIDHLNGVLYVDHAQKLTDLRRVAPVDPTDPVLDHNPFLQRPEG